ncbi:hypothetical protein SALB1_0995 [Salinisphaera sp. LB1]|nr:hypothetical protein SALB1_0995 [Salinisphaera sp. LB1]
MNTCTISATRKKPAMRTRPARCTRAGRPATDPLRSAVLF